jgi:hypothetical protein
MLILNKKSNAGATTIHDFKLYDRDTAIKTVGYWQKNPQKQKSRHEDQWDRTEDPDMNPYSYTPDFLTKVPKTYDGEKTAFSATGKTGYLHAEN